ncbi:MAG: hypothetical protein IPH84_04145 [Bacteroidales bacterium]|nr:hypothetical protein [Bacteroidales bacterium]
MKSNLILCTTCIMLFILSCGNTTPELATSVASTEFKVTQATVLSAFKKAFQEKIWQEFLYENTKPSDYYWNDDCLMIKDGVLGDEPVNINWSCFLQNA